MKRPAVRTSRIVLRATPAEKAAVLAKVSAAGVTVTRMVMDSVSHAPNEGGFVARAPEAVGDRVRVPVVIGRCEWVELIWGVCVFGEMEKLSWHEALVLGKDLS